MNLDDIYALSKEELVNDLFGFAGLIVGLVLLVITLIIWIRLLYKALNYERSSNNKDSFKL